MVYSLIRFEAKGGQVGGSKVTKRTMHSIYSSSIPLDALMLHQQILTDLIKKPQRIGNFHKKTSKQLCSGYDASFFESLWVQFFHHGHLFFFSSM
jgi:hypothetical protein